MGILGDIVSLVNSLHSEWKKRADEANIDYAELFGKFVVPSYRLLQKVHRDYLELYLELAQRLEINGVTRETAWWFSKARVQMQAERSELRVFDFPILIGLDERAANINEIANQYAATIHYYFAPDPLILDPEGSVAARLESVLVSAIELLESEPRLLAARVAECTIKEDLLIGSRQLDQIGVHEADDLVEKMISEDGSKLKDKIESEFQSKRERILNTLQAVEESLGLKDKGSSTQSTTYHLDWESRIKHHVKHQCKHFEAAMGRVQRHFFQLKILCDTK